MDLKNFLKEYEYAEEYSENYAHQKSNFKDFDAVELYCPKCRRSMPVRKRLLLVLPEGDKYEYRCSSCSESIGSKLDKKQSSSVNIIV